MYVKIKKCRFNKSGIIPIICGIIICLFSTTSSLINYIISGSRERFLLVVGCLGAEIFLIIQSKWIKENFFVLIETILLAFFPVVTINNSSWGVTNTIYYISALLVMLLCINGQWDVKFSLKYMKIMYILYGICTIIFYFTPNYYKGTIVNLFPDNRLRLIQMYNNGCMAGLTNHYSTNAMFLAIGLLIVCAQMIVNKSKEKKGKYGIQVIFFVCALLLTGKRGHILFSILAVYIIYSFVVVIRDKRNFNALFKIIGLILIVATIGIIVISIFPMLATVFVRFQQSMISGDIDNGRFIIWERAWEAFRENPVIGIGWKNFSTSYGYGLLTKDRSYDAHNVYLQLLCETGIVGSGIYVMWFINIFKKSISQLKYLLVGNQISEQECFWLIFAVEYQIFFLLYCITGNPLYDKMTFFPYFLSCGIVLYFDRKYLNKRSLKK